MVVKKSKIHPLPLTLLQITSLPNAFSKAYIYISKQHIEGLFRNLSQTVKYVQNVKHYIPPIYALMRRVIEYHYLNKKYNECFKANYN